MNHEQMNGGLTAEIAKLDEYIYRLTTILIDDDIPKAKGLEDALPMLTRGWQ